MFRRGGLQRPMINSQAVYGNGSEYQKGPDAYASRRSRRYSSKPRKPEQTFESVTVLDPDSVAAAVPEPATWALMLLGFAGLGFMVRQSRRKTSFAQEGTLSES